MRQTHQNHTPEPRPNWILRLLGVSLIGLLAFAGPASAQLGSLAGATSIASDATAITAGADATIPAIPTSVQQNVATPIGYVDVYADQHGARYCHDLRATSPVPLPVPLPVPVDAATSMCADLSQAGLNMSLDNGIAGQELDAGVDADKDGKVGFWAKVGNGFKAAGQAVLDLF
jgi:hypothetical protein